MSETKYLSERIGDSYKNNFDGHQNVFIEAQTGSGKTSAIFNVYRPYLLELRKKMLVLVPRKILREQLEENFRRIVASEPENAKINCENVCVMTYQGMAQLVQAGQMRNFDVIICDEAHYFLTESTFAAEGTQETLDYIMSTNVDVRIFLSATMDGFIEYMEKAYELRQDTYNGKGIKIYNPQNYLLLKSEPEYGSLTVKYIEDYKQIVTICQEKVKLNQKCVVFVSSKDTGEKIVKGLKDDAVLLTADNREEEEQCKVVKNLAEKQRFEQPVLVTTSVLDVGVSISDEAVTSVFIRSYEPEQLVQMLGRIRVDPERGYEGITLYLSKLTVADVNRKLQNIRSILQLIEKFERERKTAEAFMIENKENSLPFLYYSCIQGKVKSSNLAIWRYRKLYDFYCKMAEVLLQDKFAYLKKELDWLGLADDFSVDNFARIEVKNQYRAECKEKIYEIFASISGQQLERSRITKELLERVKPVFHNLNANRVRSNEPLSCNRFNDICQLEGLPYKICKIKHRPTLYQLVKTDEVERNS